MSLFEWFSCAIQLTLECTGGAVMMVGLFYYDEGSFLLFVLAGLGYDEVSSVK